jgi:type II secretory pathway pseudopilin PulG
MNRRDAQRVRPRARLRGLIMLGVLLLLALAGLAALVGAEVWATAVKREREEQLLFVGDQYRRAIESYSNASPGPVRTLPKSLAELVRDDRFPMPVRHLRRPFADPFESEWGVVKTTNGIAGVYSTSDNVPLKRSGFPDRYAHFEDARAYSDWRFIAQLPRYTGPQVARPPAVQGGR